MDHYLLAVPANVNLQLQISVVVPSSLKVYIQHGTIPSTTDYEIRNIVHENRTISVPLQDTESEIFIGVETYNTRHAEYQLIPVFYTDAVSILEIGEDIQNKINADDMSSYVMSHEPKENLDIIVRVGHVTGDVDVFVKTCQGDIMVKCIFTGYELSTAMGNDNVVRAKRVQLERHILATVDEGECDVSPCWVSIAVVARSTSQYNLSVFVNPMEGQSTSLGTISQQESVLLRYEVSNLMTTQIEFGLNCFTTDCVHFNGSLKVNRMYPESSHMGASSNEINNGIKYPTIIAGKPTELTGLYYILLTYSDGRTQQTDFSISIIETQDDELLDAPEIHSKILNYDYLTMTEPLDTHVIRVYGTEEAPEPIYFSLVPLNAYFTLCIAAPSQVAQTTNDPSTYTWCVNELNDHEEYEIILDPSTPNFEYRGQYKVLIEVEKFLTNDSVATYILQYNAGDERVILQCDETLQATLETLTEVDKYEIVAHYHEDIYIYIDDRFPEKYLQWDVYLQDENYNIVYIQQFRSRDWTDPDVSEQSLYVPWERMKIYMGNDVENVRLYLDVSLTQEVPIQYSLRYSSEQNIPEMLTTEVKKNITLLESQLDFFYIYVEEAITVYVQCENGTILIRTRIIDATSEDQKGGPEHWNRPIIPDYIETEVLEEPDDLPTKVEVRDEMVDGA